MDSNISTITLAGIISSKSTWLTNNNKHTQHSSKYSQSLVLCHFFQEILWNWMTSKEEISCAKWFTSICTTGFTWHPRHDNSSIQSVHVNVEKNTEERPNVWQLKDHLLILYSYIQRIMSHHVTCFGIAASTDLLIASPSHSAAALQFVLGCWHTRDDLSRSLWSLHTPVDRWWLPGTGRRCWQRHGPLIEYGLSGYLFLHVNFWQNLVMVYVFCFYHRNFRL